jgi:hypothetical protein
VAIDNAKALPYGLRDVKIIPLSTDGTTTGTAIDLPVAQTFSFSETEDFAELRGDDQVVASRGSGPTQNWELDSGGLPLEAYAAIAGGTVTTSGVTPNVIKRYRKLANDSRPYFKVEGRAINDNGGDLHGIVFRCKADGSIEGSMNDQEFWVTKASGKGYGSLEAANVDAVYDFIHNETAAAITALKNEIQVLVLDATGGTFTATFGAQTTGAISAAGLTAATLQTALQGLSSIGAGNISVSGGTGVFSITFQGTLGAVNQAKIALNVTSLTGGSAAVYTQQDGG